MKTLQFLSIPLTLVVILSACNLLGGSATPTQIPGQSQAGAVATMTLPVNPTQTEMSAVPPTDTPPTVTTTPVLKTIVPNTPTWSVYTYTCEIAVGGTTMTTNLAWTDRSNGEASYRVYRDKQVIATLPPNSTAYVDVVFVGTGKTVSYSVEAFNQDWRISTSTITNGCQ